MKDLKEIKVLVVDDDITFRGLIVRLLNHLEFNNVSLASGGEEAWAMIQDAQRSPNPFELILSDYKMKGVDGLELFQLVSDSEKIHPQIPFIMITAENEREAVENLICTGLREIILKPINTDSLIKKIKKVVPHR